MQFRHHPDGFIGINDFVYPLEEFLMDEPDYQLPEGFIGRTYVPGVKHSLFSEESAEPQPLEWPEGDRYIANVDAYKTAFKQRQAAAQEQKEAERWARMTPIQKRRTEYPSLQDQLDALWAGGQKLAAMKTHIEAINAKYPTE